MSALKKRSKETIEKQSGSLGNSEPEFLVIGKIGRTHGLQGELWMNLLTDFPERLGRDKTVYIGRNYREYSIKSFHLSGQRGLIRFSEFKIPEEARALTNQYVYVRADEIPELPEEEYYHHDLIGIKVIDEDQRTVGVLTEIIKTGANDVYVVKAEPEDHKEILIPAIESVIVKVDITAKVMVVRLQEWA